MRIPVTNGTVDVKGVILFPMKNFNTLDACSDKRGAQQGNFLRIREEYSALAYITKTNDNNDTTLHKTLSETPMEHEL